MELSKYKLFDNPCQVMATMFENKPTEGGTMLDQPANMQGQHLGKKENNMSI